MNLSQIAAKLYDHQNRLDTAAGTGGWQDYTPALSGLSNNSATITGRYTRVGNLVTAEAHVVAASGASAGTGEPRVTLPTTSADTSFIATGTGIYEAHDGSAFRYLFPYVGRNVNYMAVYTIRGTDAALITPGTAGFAWAFGNLSEFYVSVTYESA